MKIKEYTGQTQLECSMASLYEHVTHSKAQWLQEFMIPLSYWDFVPLFLWRKCSDKCAVIELVSYVWGHGHQKYQKWSSWDNLCCNHQITVFPRGSASTIAVQFCLSGWFPWQQPAWGEGWCPPLACQRAAGIWLDSRWRGAIVLVFFFRLLSWGAGSAVIFILFAVVLPFLWFSETLFKEVDEGLAQMLLSAVTMQEVSFIRVDLQKKTIPLEAKSAPLSIFIYN